VGKKVPGWLDRPVDTDVFLDAHPSYTPREVFELPSQPMLSADFFSGV
jgi:hypothetical protein